LFLGTLKRFNGNQQLPAKIVSRIEEYFKYRWENHKNLAVQQEPADSKLFDMLPFKVQRGIYTEYLYSNFLSVYKSIFKIMSVHRRISTLKRQRIKVLTN